MNSRRTSITATTVAAVAAEAEHQIHHDHLDEDRVDGIDAREDEAGHRPGQEEMPTAFVVSICGVRAVRSAERT